jgi:hypothetical protein
MTSTMRTPNAARVVIVNDNDLFREWQITAADQLARGGH